MYIYFGLILSAQEVLRRRQSRIEVSVGTICREKVGAPPVRQRERKEEIGFGSF